MTKKLIQGSPDHTLLDGRVRTDGYYYTVNVYDVIIFFNDGRLYRYFAQFGNHTNIQKGLAQVDPSPGRYQIHGDTIITKWAIRYDLKSYWIYEEKMWIINDSVMVIFSRNRDNAVANNNKADTLRFHPHELKDLRTPRL